MKINSHLEVGLLCKGLFAVSIMAGATNHLSAAVIGLSSVDAGLVGAELFNDSAASSGDLMSIGVWNGTEIPFGAPTVSANVTLLLATTHPFVFSYSHTQNKYTFTAPSVGSVELPFQDFISAQNFILQLQVGGSSGSSVTVSDLVLTGGSFTGGIDLSYTKSGTGITNFYLPTTSLVGDFSIAGNFSFLGAAGNKSGMRIFVADVAVPEPASIAFGAVLVGGLAMMEIRRRKRLE